MAKLSHDLLGKQFVTELCYKPVASNKVLVICNLPDLDPGVIKQSMEVTLRSKTKAVVDKFAVAENTAYITFCDSSGNWHVFVMHHFNVIVILCAVHAMFYVSVTKTLHTCRSNTFMKIVHCLQMLLKFRISPAMLLLDLLSCTASAIPLFLMQHFFG